MSKLTDQIHAASEDEALPVAVAALATLYRSSGFRDLLPALREEDDDMAGELVEVIGEAIDAEAEAA